MILYKRLSDDHKQRRGNSLSRHVCHNYREVPLVHHKEIVEVSTHFLGRIHGRINIYFLSLGKRWENARQHIRLNTRCDGKLGVYAFLFGCYRGEIFGVFRDIGFHFFDCPREYSDLVPLRDIKRLCRRQVSLRETLRLFCERFDRLYYATPQYYGIHENRTIAPSVQKTTCRT